MSVPNKERTKFRGYFKPILTKLQLQTTREQYGPATTAAAQFFPAKG